MKRKEMYITNYKALGATAPGNTGVVMTAAPAGADQEIAPGKKPQAGDPQPDGGGLDPMKIAVYAAGAFLIYKLLFKR